MFCFGLFAFYLKNIKLDGPDASALLGILDTPFLLTYGIAMFGSGFWAERVSLRYFFTFGMLFSTILTYIFGIAKTYDIHLLWYFIAVQALAGMFKTTGWPGVVTVVERWFGKAKRGLSFSISNSHISEIDNDSDVAEKPNGNAILMPLDTLAYLLKLINYDYEVMKLLTTIMTVTTIENID